MLSRNARQIPWKRSLVVAVLLIAVSATVALADEQFTVIFGTSGNDTITRAGQAGNYRIYGFAGKDSLTGGKGDNVLVGDGHCPPGSATDDATTGHASVNGDNDDDQYCDVEEVPGDGGDTLRGGGGNNGIFGGGGPNTMYGGQGVNYIESGPSTNLIYGGPVGDVINASDGTNTIYPGKGTNFIDTVGHGIDHVYCTGKHDYVRADRNDVIKNCAHVSYPDATKDRANSRHKKHSSASRHRSSHRATDMTF
jgi:Ca2+-binding RTX toxin-like protein